MNTLIKYSYVIMKFIKTWLHADLPLHSEGQTRTPEDKRLIFGAKTGYPGGQRPTPEDRGRTPEDSAHPGRQVPPDLQRSLEYYTWIRHVLDM